MTSTALRDSAGRVIGAQDSLPLSEAFAKYLRPIVAAVVSRPRRAVAVDRDISVIDDTAATKTLAELIPGYNRLR